MSSQDMSINHKIIDGTGLGPERRKAYLEYRSRPTFSHAKKDSGGLIKDVINYIVENQKLQDEVDKISHQLDHKRGQCEDLLTRNRLLCAEVAALRVLLCVEFDAGPEEVKNLLMKHEMDTENRLDDVERVLRRFSLYGRLASDIGKWPIGGFQPKPDKVTKDDNNVDAGVEAAPERMGKKSIGRADDEDTEDSEWPRNGDDYE
ncbi:hypothetical protein K488DRAFT_75230 [Vararia minispora EC-137]|uniref:Uncharacterized protein n=1 Tax=Vararia minispora EC-137 TaxID=1314806 RepID=A0ACB8Q4Q8_9AGAM|nr:hypothetical protein K488DRAFT_75230 [Vararia minispora EC-137]